MAVALGVALAVGLQADDSAAKKRKKPSVTATVEGKRRAFKRKNVTVDYRNGFLTIVATILKPG
jgi:hypothetical protein